jgi:hypothetical protein
MDQERLSIHAFGALTHKVRKKNNIALHLITWMAESIDHIDAGLFVGTPGVLTKKSQDTNVKVFF